MSSTTKVNEILKEVVKYGQINVLKTMLKIWSKSNRNLHDVMKIAIQYGTLDILKTVIQHGADINDTEETTRNTVLHHAVSEGKLEMVKYLVNSKIKQIPNRHGNEPLHVALNCLMANAKEYKVFQEIVLFLIENSADLNAKNREGNTPHDLAIDAKDLKIIHFLSITRTKNTLQALLKGQCSKFNDAVRNGNLDLVQELLTNNDDLLIDGTHLTENISIADEIECLRRLPLSIAVINRHFEIAKLLKHHGANLENTKNGFCRSKYLLFGAIRHQDVEMVQVLAELGALKYVNSNPFPVVFDAIKNMNIEIVDILLKNGAVDINHKYKNFGTALHFFTLFGIHEKEGGLNVVKFLITQCNAKQLAGHKGRTPLHIAIERKNYEIAKFLLENEANVNAIANNKQSPLHLLAFYRSNSGNHVNDQFAKLLINKGADINALDNKNQTPLKIAIEKENFYLVQTLIGSGAKINGSKYNNAIFQAVESYSKNYLQVLIKHGADMNCISENTGKTLLNAAIVRHDLAKIKILVKAGANVNTKDINGLSPLHLSAQDGYKDITEFLLQNGASINITDSENCTPLHYAVTFERVDSVKFLVEKGADLSIKSRLKSQTPLDIARKNNLLEISEILVKKTLEIREAGEPSNKRFKVELDDCVICCNTRSEIIVFHPCGHAKTCENCAMKIMYVSGFGSKTCPVCREEVASYMKVFV